jgi:hypothetical protein
MSRSRVQRWRPALSWRSSTGRGLLTGAAVVLALSGLVGPAGAASVATLSATGVNCTVYAAAGNSAVISACTPARTSLGVRWQ